MFLEDEAFSLMKSLAAFDEEQPLQPVCASTVQAHVVEAGAWVPELDPIPVDSMSTEVL